MIINKTYQKVLINVSTYLSFVFAYIMFGFGLLPVKNTFSIILNFLTFGVFFYVIFEVIATFSYSMMLKFVPNFEINQKDYKYYLRLIIIARNLLLALIIILFIFYPVASVWGYKISHIVFTVASIGVGVYLLRGKFANNMYRSLAVIGALTFVYLAASLFLGVIA